MKPFVCRVVLLKAAFWMCRWLVVLLAAGAGGNARATVTITELLAGNSAGLRDEDGDSPDWIELFNSGTNSVRLEGWFLTDAADDLTKWRLPATNIAPHAFLVVFASGKDRAVAGAPLHTSFALDMDGEYLALVQPDGQTIASEFAPAFPRQFPNISYGVGQDLRVTKLVSNTSPARVYVPGSGILGTTWTDPDYNDVTWRAGTNGVGYETYAPGFAVRNIRANGSVCDLATALSVTENPALQAAVFTVNAGFIDYFNTGGRGHFTHDLSFPGFASGTDENYFVTEVTGIITVPTSGNWTFGVNSDDGFEASIGSLTFSHPAPRGAADTLATFNLVAGEYPVRLVFYECGGGSELEFFAASGTYTAFGSTFRLIGDTDNGGLAVKSLPLGAGGASLRAQITTEVQAQMAGRGSSAYVRLPFAVADPTAFSTLTLRLKYNDGFVAYLNGSEIARRHAPAGAQWNSTATVSRRSADSVVFEDIDVTASLSLLQPGANLLAIHGLNDSANGNDFLILAELVESKVLGITNHYFATPTPGTFNSSGFYAFVENLKFTPGRGWFANTNLSVTITSATPGVTVRYTTDGSTPSGTNGLIFSGAIQITNTTFLRAVGFAADFEPTELETHSYIFLDQIQRQSTNVNYAGGSAGDYTLRSAITQNPLYRETFQSDLLSVPTLSITMAWEDLFGPSGIWSNPGGYGVGWERPCSLEYLRPDGEKGFHINCGIRIQGGASRNAVPKHGLRVLFKSLYGPSKLEYDLYPDSPVKEFDTLTIHAAFNDQWLWGGNPATMQRDQWCRDTQNAMGGYGPRGTYVHLYLNGLYWGLYNIGEKGDASFAAHYLGGDKEEYDAFNSDELIDGNRDAWNAMFAIASAGITSDAAFTNLSHYLNIPNFIDYLLLNFYAANTDWPGHNWNAARRRVPGAGFHFFSWDAEWTLGLRNTVTADRTGVTNGSPGRLYTALRAHPEFRRMFGDHAQKRCFDGGALTPGPAEARWRKRAAEIDRAIVGESARWSNGQDRETWLAAQSSVLSWFPQRTGILINQLRNAGLYPPVDAPVFSPAGGLVPPEYPLTLTNPNSSGALFYTIDGSDPRAWGGGVAPSAQVHAAPLTIGQATFVRARVRDGTNWSALVEAAFYVVQDFRQLVVSELMYHPPDFGLMNGDEFEFIELKNSGSTTLDLTGLEFTQGIGFAFTNGTTLAPGEFFLLARNPVAFAAKYPTLPLNGVYSGRLDNNGETLILAHVLGTNVFSFRYETKPPWPITPDGYGFSLVRAATSGDPEEASSWRASAQADGSPGLEDPPVNIPPLVINEILTHTDPPQMDAIELHNPTAAAADLGGWFLSDEAGAPRKFRIPDGQSIPPGGFAVFTESDFNPQPGLPTSFALSSLGESLYLFSGDATTNLTGYSHSLEFGPAANGVSFGRHIISTGEEQWPAQATNTLGSANAGPRVGPVVINEILYHPAPGYDEFLELHNLSAQPVSLFDPAHPTNGWKLSGMGFTFSNATVLPAGGFLLLVPIEPAAFRAKYGIAPEVQILGPYPGVLQDSGERLRLERPDAPQVDPNGVVVVPEIVMDEVRYNDKAPWPTSADGDGPSIQRLFPAAFGNEPGSWFASGITPGATNTLNLPPACVLTRPLPNATFRAPTNLTLRALAADPDGAVVRVEFFDGDFKLGETTGMPFEFLWVNPSVGPHMLSAKARDNRLAVGPSAPVSIVVEPPPVGSGTGLKAQYFDNVDLTGTVVSRVDATVDFDWGSGPPDAAIAADTFSVRWTGVVQPRYSGLYTFYTISDDGVRLWVNDTLLIDNWTNHGTTEDAGPISLEAGQFYSIRLEFYENTGAATARLSWSSAFVPKEIIPQTQLYAEDLPVILVPPASQTVGVGSTVTFSVVAANAPTGFQWHFNGTPIAGATGASLVLPNVQTSQAGSYSVTVANASGTATSVPATLTVLLPPAITEHPEDQAGSLGATIMFRVTAEGTPPLQYQWRFQGTNLPGASTDVLVLNNVQAAQAGFYNVLVSNAAGTVVSSNAFLALDIPATVLKQPESVTINSGGTNTTTTNTVIFSVVGTGLGPLQYQWTLWGTNVPAATNAVLVIPNAALDHAGPYQVRLTDSVRSVWSDPAHLTVLVKAAILVPPLAQSVVRGDTARLTVLAGPDHPTLPLTYRWRRGSWIIEPDGGPVLVLTNMQTSGFYSVLVSNAFGAQIAHVPVRVTVLDDADGDGLPDEFETAVGLNPTNAADAALDFDDDGMNNLAEYVAGTDVRDPGSLLKMEIRGTSDGGTIEFQAISNVSYSVEHCANAAAAGWNRLIDVPAVSTNGRFSLPVVTTNLSRSYFRVVTPSRLP